MFVRRLSRCKGWKIKVSILASVSFFVIVSYFVPNQVCHFVDKEIR